jgi:transcriptional accessory protein Tex/SPT6
MCSSNLNSIRQFITAAGTTIGGTRETEEETFHQELKRRFHQKLKRRFHQELKRRFHQKLKRRFHQKLKRRFHQKLKRRLKTVAICLEKATKYPYFE